MAQSDFDEEKTETLLDLENLCENFMSNVDFLGFSHIDFDKLGRKEKNQVEEA